MRVETARMVSTKFNSSYNASQHRQNIHLPTTFDLIRPLLAAEHESLQFVATDCLRVTTLGFVEIDDIPNGIEILAIDRVQRTDRKDEKSSSWDSRRPLH